MRMDAGDVHLDLSIVVLSYNRRAEIQDRFGVLTELCSRYGCEVIIVDNASNDGTIEFLKNQAIPAGMKILFNDENLGVARGRNEGWSRSSKRYILNIDDDTHLNAFHCRELVRQIAQNRDIGVLSPLVAESASACTMPISTPTISETANFHGACHILRTDLLAQVGLLDRECAFGGEELEYSMRVRAAGYKVVSFSGIVVFHNAVRRVGRERAWRRLAWISNFVRILFRGMPFGTALLFSSRYLVSHLFSLLKDGNLQLAVRLVGAYLGGMVAGMRTRAPLPKHVVRFYSREDLRPEFGNVPLMKKIRSYWSAAHRSTTGGP